MELVSCTLSVGQKGGVPFTVIVGVGSGLTVMVVEVDAEQLFAFVTVTIYVVVLAGVTAMAAVVAPVLQRYVVPAVAVRVAEVPTQI